jgi:hypothetical protein
VALGVDLEYYKHLNVNKNSEKEVKKISFHDIGI